MTRESGSKATAIAVLFNDQIRCRLKWRFFCVFLQKKWRFKRSAGFALLEQFLKLSTTQYWALLARYQAGCAIRWSYVLELYIRNTIQSFHFRLNENRNKYPIMPIWIIRDKRVFPFIQFGLIQIKDKKYTNDPAWTIRDKGDSQ